MLTDIYALVQYLSNIKFTFSHFADNYIQSDLCPYPRNLDLDISFWFFSWNLFSFILIKNAFNYN